MGDQLNELCLLINQVTLPVREKMADARGGRGEFSHLPALQPADGEGGGDH